MEATTAMMWFTLMTMATPSSDNVTEASFYYNVSTSASAPPGKSWSPSSSSWYISPIAATAFFVANVAIAVMGLLANAYVLLALLFSKNSSSSKVNTFITHQTVIDLTACAFLFVSLILNKQRLQMTGSLAIFVCWFFGSYAISGSAGNASIWGLVIITVERYVKIVHPVAYRNHYRRWMTRAGIIFPWIVAVCTGLIPSWATLTLNRGRCIIGSVGSTRELQLTWYIARFTLLYLGPLAFFIFGYWKILAVIRRQKKQVGQNQAPNAAATAAEKQNRRTEMNVVRTMVLVSVSFAVCFACWSIYPILTSLELVPRIGTLYPLFTVFKYANRCLNPFIYATQYEVITRWWKAVMYRVLRGQNVEQAAVTVSSGPKATSGAPRP